MINIFEKIYDFIDDKISDLKRDKNFYQHGLRNNGSAVYDYYMMMSLNEKDYPDYLKRAYFLKTGRKLNLRRPKDINEKIQWLKLYDNLPIKTDLTDKIKVRDWVESKIGSECLKPALQICDSFDEINFETLTESFIIKCNHGCRWHAIIKDKKKFLDNPKLVDYVKRQLEGWLEQSFFGWSDFELQYKNIKPRLIVEELLREKDNDNSAGIQVYCFNSKPQIINKYNRIHKEIDWENRYTTYDKDYNIIDLKLLNPSVKVTEEADELVKEAVRLSEILAKEFKFVRVDWFLFQGKLYFEELTFTPQSGYFQLSDEYSKWNKELGKMLNLKGN